jgi:hypothetical protein
MIHVFLATSGGTSHLRMTPRKDFDPKFRVFQDSGVFRNPEYCERFRPSVSRLNSIIIRSYEENEEHN